MLFLEFTAQHFLLLVFGDRFEIVGAISLLDFCLLATVKILYLV